MFFTIICVKSATVDVENSFICLKNSDCKSLQICEMQNKIQSICVHKNFSSVKFREIISFLIIMMVSIISSISGIGGGIFYVPICLILLQFNANASIPLSEAIICGTGLIK